MNGWPARLFQAAWVTEAFKCPLCHDVFRDAAVAECGHTYCLPCVTTQWELMGDAARCGVCRDDLETVRPNWAVRQALEAQPVRCDCQTWTGTLARYATQHRAECSEATEACPACTAAVPLRELAVHTVTRCPRRPVPCRVCGSHVPWLEREHHQQYECALRAVACDACGDDVPELLLGAHRQHVCPAALVDCPVAPGACPQGRRDALDRHLAREHTPLEVQLRREAELYKTLVLALARPPEADAVVDVDMPID